jgi:PAS domain S-box-containing protein
MTPILILNSFFLLLLLILNGLILFFFKNRSEKQKSEPKPELTTSTPQESTVTREQEEKLRDDAILANIGEGLVIIDKYGKIITFNKAAESMIGWTAKEAIGHDLADIIQIDYQSSIKVTKQTIGNRSSLYFIRKDKSKFPADISTSSFVQDGNILGTITLFRDVTAERNIDTMKNEFISLASHQLRTPLAAIKWYSKILLEGDTGKLLPEQIEAADSIYTSTERMIDLVNSLLNITRIESGRIIVEPKPTDLKQMIEDIVKEIKIRYMDKKQNISLSVQGEIPIIDIDPRLIRQVFVNLLTNAAKYTPEKGSVIIAISKNDTDVITEVRDTGVGIPEKEQQKVFDKFYRGENTANQETSGTGLGLYLVKDIVEISKGKIWFKSQEGKGTIFWVSLPLAGTPAKKGVLSLET